jgi:predicted ester cyclase
MASQMNSIDFVKSYMIALEGKNFDYVRDNTSDDMLFSGPIPQPIGKRDYMEMYRALFRAFPDWRYNLSNFKQVGNRVFFHARATATHSGVLDLPDMDIHNYQPTGKHLQLPSQEIIVELRDGKVARIELTKVEGGGLNDLLEKVGYHVSQPSRTK